MMQINVPFIITSELYGPEMELIGIIDSEWQLNDIRIQIAILHKSNEAYKKESGYSIKFQDHLIPIYTDGSISYWPTGFYDETERQLSALIKYKKYTK